MGKIRDQGLSKGIQHTKIIRSIGLRGWVQGLSEGIQHTKLIKGNAAQ